MDATKGKNQSLVRTTNQKLIVDELLAKKQLSRTDLAKCLGLSNPSISKNVEDLKKRGMLIEGKPVQTDLGRRPVMLSFNADCGRIVSVDLGGSKVIIAITSMSGEIINKTDFEFDFVVDSGGERTDYPQLLQKVADSIDELCRKYTDDRSPLLGIGIAAPGRIEKNTARYIKVFRFKNHENVDTSKFFKDRFNVDVLMQNDVTFAVLGEHKYGAGKNCANLMFVRVDKGIGAGLLLNGELYNFSGELGSVIPDCKPLFSRPSTENPEYENLAKCASTGAIVKRAKSLLGEYPGSVLHSVKNIDFPDITQYAAADDPLCLQVLNESAIYIAHAISNLLMILHIEKIIIGGGVRDFGDRYLNLIRDFLTQTDLVHQPPIIEWAKCTDEEAIRGAAAWAIDNAIVNMIEKKL